MLNSANKCYALGSNCVCGLGFSCPIFGFMFRLKENYVFSILDFAFAFVLVCFLLKS